MAPNVQQAYTQWSILRKKVQKTKNVFTRLSFLPKFLNVFQEIVAIQKVLQCTDILGIGNDTYKKTPLVNLISARNYYSLFN